MKKAKYAGLVAALLAGPAWVGAQDANRGGVLEEIVVTAQKREQNLTEVPLSLTVYDAERLELIRATELNDYLQFTPNVSVQGRSDRFSQFFTIRGTQNFGGRANALGIYVDEFNVAPSSTIRGYNQNLLDVERIEVLRGPQGTTFGRNALGGALNIVTSKPGDVFAASATLDAGSADGASTILAKGSVNLPVTPDLAIRLSGAYEEEDGWAENVLVNPAVPVSANTFESTGFRAAVRWLPTDRLTADFTATYEDAEARPLNAFPTGEIETGSLVEVFGPLFAVPIPYDPLGIGFYPDTTDRVVGNTDLRRVETLMLNTRLELDLERLRLISVTGFIDLDASLDKQGLDPDTFNIAGDTSGLNFIWAEFPQDDLQSFSQEFRAEFPISDRLDAVAGVLYAEDEEEQEEAFGTGPDNFFVITIFPPNSIIGANITTNETRQIVAFGEISWQATDAMEVLVGGRYTRDEVEQRSLSLTNNNLTSDEETFNDFSGRLSLVYELNDQVNTYFTFSQAFKSGGFDLATGTSYDSETVDNYEIGLKGDFLNGRLGATVSAFFMDWQDVQVNVTDLDETSPTFLQVFTQNAADAELTGIEAEIVARPIDALTLQLGVGYLDTEFTGQDCDDPDFITSGESCLNGSDLPRQSDWSVNWSAQYDHDFASDRTGFLRVDGLYRSEYFDFAGSLPVKADLLAPGYNIWNIRAGLDFGQWAVSAYVENVDNDREVLGLRNPGGINPSGILAVLNEPRTYGIRVTVDLGED